MILWLTSCGVLTHGQTETGTSSHGEKAIVARNKILCAFCRKKRLREIRWPGQAVSVPNVGKDIARHKEFMCVGKPPGEVV